MVVVFPLSKQAVFPNLVLQQHWRPPPLLALIIRVIILPYSYTLEKLRHKRKCLHIGIFTSYDLLEEVTWIYMKNNSLKTCKCKFLFHWLTVRVFLAYWTGFLQGCAIILALRLTGNRMWAGTDRLNDHIRLMSGFYFYIMWMIKKKTT